MIWNYEIPWLLISGGDDSLLVCWDIRSNTILSTTIEPCISISSMSSHQMKPFSIVSSHLDNSVIFWDLMGLSDIFQTQMKFILDLGLLEVTCDPNDLMTPGDSVKGKLSGE